MPGASREGVIPRWSPLAGVVLLVAGAWLLQAALPRAADPGPDEIAVAYRINRRNFAANCEGVDAGASAVLAKFCTDAAQLLTRHPACDAECRAATAAFTAASAGR